MGQIYQAVSFASGIYRKRAGVIYHGYLRRDPMSRLRLRPGRDDPYAIYELLRSRGALVPTRKGDWVSTSYRVCDAVLRDRRLSTRPAEQPAEPDQGDMSFLGMNPPDHTRLRRLAQPAFSPRAVATYSGRIERTVGTLLGTAAAAGEFDLVSSLAAPLPIAVISDLLGIPDADTRDFARYGAAIGSALDGIKSLRHAQQLIRNQAELERMFGSLFALRRGEPRDDIISRMAAAEGDQIQPDEMLAMCFLLLIAGFETTVNLIGNAVLALLGHREQWQALCEDPGRLAPMAVEETLRFDPPVQGTSRIALEPLELEGRPVTRNQEVNVLIGAANRDPEIYPRPAVFDIHRAPGREHLAFSSGIHYCLGQPLARLEATITLRLLAERMPGMSLAGAVQRRNAAVIRGPARLPVRAGPARAVPAR
jgi:cytochrome P450